MFWLKLKIAVIENLEPIAVPMSNFNLKNPIYNMNNDTIIVEGRNL